MIMFDRSWVFGMVTFDRLLVGEGGFDLDFRIIRSRSHKQSHLRTRTGEYVGGDSIDRVSGVVIFDRLPRGAATPTIAAQS
jgi:hypothetical protein